MSTIDDLFKQQKALLQSLPNKLDLSKDVELPAHDFHVQLKEKTLARAKTKLQILQDAKAKAIKEYDEQIKKQETSISKLSNEIAADKKSLKEIEKSVKLKVSERQVIKARANNPVRKTVKKTPTKKTVTKKATSKTTTKKKK